MTDVLLITQCACNLRFVMNNNESIRSYRSFLRDILMEKQKKNPQFSMRSFAKTLGLDSSFISMVLRGKRDLSFETAALMSEKMNLNENEAKMFDLLLRIEKSNTATQRARLLEELEVLEPSTKGKRDLAVDQFRVIADWYHLPLQLLIELDGFKWSDENAAKALGITVHEVRDALERLAALELIDMTDDKKPKKAEGRLMVESPFKNEALRKYHTQMLQKTIGALETQTPDRRFTGTMNLAFDESQLKEAHVVMKEALTKLASIADQPKKSKKLFHANLNLIELTTQTTQTTSKSKGRSV